LVGSELFFAESATNQILILITLIISLGFGYMLVKSVKLEVQRKEELQLMSNKLAQANDKLRQLDNSKSEFISIASHQLRTPLTAIKGFVSMLLEGSYGKVEPKQEEALNKTYTSTERLINLVEDLLNISRMESGRMEFKFAPATMPDLCQEIIDTFVLRAKERKLSLEYKKPEGHIPELMIDAGKVKEIVSNMVDNALKYTPKGGVTLKLFQEGDKVRVTVSDTGIGIPATELPYLFNKFSRGKDVGRLNTGGTGLGLYVGKGMIENNGGKIWAESDGEGKGSRFIIELPVKQSEELLERWG
jgi:signal transduction histidine kinase